jgi:cytosine/creatinine deaminase
MTDLATDRQLMQSVANDIKRELTLVPNAIPIGAALVIDGAVRARGCNQRVQQGNPILHGETACLQNAGTSIAAAEFSRATLYTSLSPCVMCAGAILRFKIPRVVIGENTTFQGEELLLKLKGVEVIVVDNADCIEMMRTFIRTYPEIWNDDITYLPKPPPPDYSQLDFEKMKACWKQLEFRLPE